MSTNPKTSLVFNLHCETIFISFSPCAACTETANLDRGSTQRPTDRRELNFGLQQLPLILMDADPPGKVRLQFARPPTSFSCYSGRFFRASRIIHGPGVGIAPVAYQARKRKRGQLVVRPSLALRVSVGPCTMRARLAGFQAHVLEIDAAIGLPCFHPIPYALERVLKQVGVEYRWRGPSGWTRRINSRLSLTGKVSAG